MKNMNEKNAPKALSDEELAGLSGGFVWINKAGCYELYDDKGNYEWTFRGDQLQELRAYAKANGISDRFITDEEFRKMKARGRIKA